MKRRNRWRTELPRTGLVAGLRSWLREPGSLTARCIRSSDTFRVQLLAYGKGRPEAAEGLAADRHPAFVREVALVCDGVPVIFAHTTLSTAVNGRLGRWMARLGSRSLGSLLFSYPGFRRGAIEYLRLDRRHPLYRRAAAQGMVDRHLWARRSLHCLDGQQVLVTEVFLPAIATR